MQQFSIKSRTSPVTESQIAGVGKDFPLIETNGYYIQSYLVILFFLNKQEPQEYFCTASLHILYMENKLLEDGFLPATD